jgi:hypothetical protein
MTDEEILEIWNMINHDQSVTQQLIEFAQAIEYCLFSKIKAVLSVINDLELGEDEVRH